jgi:hypothetical protein
MSNSDGNGEGSQSLPGLGRMLATILAAAAVLYPFGLLVFERQLEVAFSLDSRIAWHLTSLLSQPEVIIHGMQALIAPSTLLLAAFYIIYSVAAPIHALNAIEGRRLLVLNDKVKQAKVERDKFVADLRAKCSRTEQELESLETVSASDYADSTVPYPDLAARRNRLDQLRVTVDSIRNTITESDKRDSALQSDLKNIEPDIRRAERFQNWSWALAGALGVVLVLSPIVYIATDFSFTKLFWASIAALAVMCAAFCVYRHAETNPGKWYRFSQWLLYGLACAYASALIVGYFTASASRYNLLPSITVGVRGARPVKGWLVNEAGGNWYVIIPPVTRVDAHKRTYTIPAQVRVIRDAETDSVVMGSRN